MSLGDTGCTVPAGLSGPYPDQNPSSWAKPKSTSESASALAQPPAAGSTSSPEPLACVACRSKKLKCGREPGACTRCVRLKAKCIYPESRRKPAARRRNASELEARLAHVEDLLKDATKSRGLQDPDTVPDGSVPSSTPDNGISPENTAPPVPQFTGGPTTGAGTEDFDFDVDPVASGLFTGSGDPHVDGGFGITDDIFGAQLVGMGMFEALPPFDMVEDLHNLYFERQHTAIPMVHKGRYLQAFHSAPHMRPPMCLQYAIWAMAAQDSDKYSSYNDVFYRRARQYLEADELKGVGEHFITVPHAQAWILIAAYEARSMRFTRTAMSTARAIQLCNMMHLNRLDDTSSRAERVPTIMPPQSWVELEERRRTFWSVFCLNSHASVSTGWPTLIDPSTIATNLPSTEEAFELGREEKTSTLTDLFTGSSYSTFAGAVGVCHIYNQVLAHIDHDGPSEGADSLDYGAFWKRHRELDNLLLTAFMSVPDKFRLRSSPMYVHMDLNLHSAVICLHMAAVDRAERHSIGNPIKTSSLARLLMSAHEIVKTMKTAPPSSQGSRSPLVTLSLYCAAVAFILLIKESAFMAAPVLGTSHHENLRFIIEAIGRIARTIITRAFLIRLSLDLAHNGIDIGLKLPVVDPQLRERLSRSIPLLVRTSISRHTDMSTPLPGSLPLSRGSSLASVAACLPNDMTENAKSRYGCIRFNFPGGIANAPVEAVEEVAPTPSSRLPPSPPLGAGAAAVTAEAGEDDNNEPAGRSKRRRVVAPGGNTPPRDQPTYSAFDMAAGFLVTHQRAQGAGAAESAALPMELPIALPLRGGSDAESGKTTSTTATSEDSPPVAVRTVPGSDNSRGSNNGSGNRNGIQAAAEAIPGGGDLDAFLDVFMEAKGPVGAADPIAESGGPRFGEATGGGGGDGNVFVSPSAAVYRGLDAQLFSDSVEHPWGLY